MEGHTSTIPDVAHGTLSCSTTSPVVNSTLYDNNVLIFILVLLWKHVLIFYGKCINFHFSIAISILVL